MANTVFQLRRNSTSGVRPTTSSIQSGELAINLTDGIAFSTNGSTVFELGGNVTSIAVGNSTVRQTANSTGVYVNGNINLTQNNTKLIFNPTAASGAGNVYFIQQSDDNFVFYSTTNTGATRAIFNVYANTNAPNQNSAIKFNVPVDLSTQPLYANNSTGSAGQVLTTNSTGTYWSSVSALSSVNTAAQYTWSNLHTFQANVSFTGYGLGLSSNTTAIYFNGVSDGNWKIGRNTGSTTKFYYSNNTLDIIAAASNLEGFVIGQPSGNTYLETGYAGTFTKNPIYVGNATVNATINSTAITGNSISVGSTTTSTFFNYNGQSNSSAGNFVANAYAALGGAGGNYLAFGQQTNYAQWIQSGYSAAVGAVYYSIVLNPLGGNVGIGNTAPDATLKVTGTANVSGNVVIGGTLSAANVTASLFTGNVTGTASNATNLNSQPGSYYTNATNITTGTLPYAQLPANVVFWSNTNTFTAPQTFSANVTASSYILANNVNATVYTTSNVTVNSSSVLVGNGATAFFANSTVHYQGNSTQNTSANSTYLFANVGLFLSPQATSAANTSEGSVFYDVTNHALNVYADDPSTPLELGQQQVFRAVNKTGSALAFGSAVYINGAQGNRPSVALACANSSATFSVAGFVFSSTGIANNAEGFILTNGLLQGINTVGMTSGAVVYLSATTPGAVTTTEPAYPNYNIALGQALNATPNGKIYVSIVPNYLAGIPNTAISISNGTLLTYSNNFTFDYANNVLLIGNSSANVTVGYVNAGGSFSYLQIQNNGNTSVEASLINNSNGANASGDLIVYDNSGIQGPNYIDLGMNSNNYSVVTWTINGPSDGYLYTSNSNLSIGTQGANLLSFFTGGTLAANERLRITSGGNVGIGNTAPDATLKVTGNANVSGNLVIGGSITSTNVTAALFTGNVTGTASNATNLNSQPGSYYTNATNITTGTLADARLSANYNTGTALTANNASYLGGTAAASYQLNSTLNANIASYLPTYTGTVNSSIYQTGGGIGAATSGVYANATIIFIGNSSVNTTINSTAFTGTANNTTYLNGQLASYYTNATNITTGTLPYAQLGSNVVNTSAAFTITGMHTYSNGITFSNTVTANGSNGTSGQVLTSSGATGNVYWSTVTGVNTAAQYTFSNTITFSGNLTSSSWVNLKTYVETASSPAIAASALTLDLSNSSVFNVNLNSSITTLSITNAPATSGAVSGFVLIFTGDGTARTVVWPSSTPNIRWANGAAPTITSTLNKRDVYVLFTTDNGSTYNAFISGQNI